MLKTIFRLLGNMSLKVLRLFAWIIIFRATMEPIYGIFFRLVNKNTFNGVQGMEQLILTGDLAAILTGLSFVTMYIGVKIGNEFVSELKILMEKRKQNVKEIHTEIETQS